MSFTVTATEGGNTAVGMGLLVKVVTGAAASQPGAVHGVVGNATPSDTITPSATGSWVYGALLGGNAAFTALAANTPFTMNVNNNGLHYIAFRNTSPATTTSGSALTLGATGSASGISVALCEILASGTLAEVSGPGVASTAVASNVTTAAFSPPVGALLVAMVACNGSTGTTTMAITDTSGLGMTWTEQARQNGGSHAYSGVWTAVVPASVTSGVLSFFD